MFYTCRSGKRSDMCVLSGLLSAVMGVLILGAGFLSVRAFWEDLAQGRMFYAIRELVLIPIYWWFGIWLLKTARQIIRFERRLYGISKNGITLLGKDKVPYEIPWNEVKEVSVYAYQATPTEPPKYSTVYCILLKPRQKNFEYKLFRSDFYAARHYDDFVVIDRNEESTALLKENYPGEIPDRRWTQIRGFRGD